MRSPAAAIAWELRSRHRWGLMAILAYLLVLIPLRAALFEPGQVANFESDQHRTFAFLVIVPLSTIFMYLVAVFSFGLSGDLAARQSIYPSRMFSLPVSTAGLAGWPMLYGTVTMALLWFVARSVAIWPEDIHVPLIWPALLAASSLAWIQALTWMPYPLRGLRVITPVILMTALDAVVIIAFELEASEPVMLALLAPNIPLAYLTARFAVGRARQGEIPDWHGLFAGLGGIVRIGPGRGKQFRSPAHAQAWFEWRRHGRSLPGLVAVLLPFELSLLFLIPGVPAIVFGIVLLALLTPPFMSVFVAATVSRADSSGSNPYGVTPFIATRPATDAQLIAAKLRLTVRSTLATWLLTLAMIAIAIVWSGSSSILTGWFDRIVEIMGMPRGTALLLLGLVLLVAETWKQLVQSLFIGMSGREWIVKGSAFLALVLLTIAVLLVQWILGDHAVFAQFLRALPVMLAVLAAVKLATSAWLAIRLHERRSVGDRVLLLGAACWTVAVFALYGLLRWLLPALLFRGYFLALVAILAVPLARISAAPLMLSWNRHR